MLPTPVICGAFTRTESSWKMQIPFYVNFTLTKFTKHIILLVLLSLYLTACSSKNISTNNFCDIAHPIYLDKKDNQCISERLKADIYSHWLVGHELCDWETAK